MNKEELSRNVQLTDFDVKDLNSEPKLPYDDNTFDVITNCVSVDYLNKPLEVFQEMHRCAQQWCRLTNRRILSAYCAQSAAVDSAHQQSALVGDPTHLLNAIQTPLSALLLTAMVHHA